MFGWYRKKEDVNNTLQSQIRDMQDKLQQVAEENRKLQHDVRRLQEDVKLKNRLLANARKYKVFNGLLLSDEQSAVVDLLESTKNCYFITGKAGTGKSTILKYFVSHTGKKVVALAPTGIAANIIGGRTIHSFFGLGLSIQDTTDSEAVNRGINADQNLIEKLEVIIIDEVSMVRSDVMDMIDRKLRVARGNDLPYGGIQMVLFGDLFQLAPVVKGQEGPIIQNRYQTPFFFGAPSAKERFTVCSLTQIYRQTDTSFIRMLNKIRVGIITQSELDELYQYCGNHSSKRVDDLFVVPTNERVNAINEEKLNLLKGKPYTYYAVIEGDATEDDTPATYKITLKVGAIVMMLCNDINKNFVNGTLAKVVELTEDMIKVYIVGVGTVNVDPYTWTKYKYVYNAEEDKIVTKQTGSFTQFPLKLAYAITVHKSQGQTFDHVIIDFQKSGAFAPGQTYVALSRCRRLEDIHLTRPLQKQDIIVDHEAMDYLKRKAVPVSQFVKHRISF